MKNKAKFSRSLRQGGYLAGVTAGVLAVVVLVNLMMGQLPSNWKEFDLTDNSLYEITDTSKDFLSGLEQDVQIVVLAEDGTTDARIEKFLDRYVALSSHLSLSYVDPVAHPQQASQYDADSDSVVVLCEETGKSRAIPFDDIITYSYTNYFSMSESTFDAEGQLTSAVDYVTSDANHTVYTVTGHGEEDLSDPIVSAIEKANLNLESVSPALEGGVPEDCDVLVVNAPHHRPVRERAHPAGGVSGRRRPYGVPARRNPHLPAQLGGPAGGPGPEAGGRLYCRSGQLLSPAGLCLCHLRRAVHLQPRHRRL